ncbi:unnamed protein product, partial [Brassica rapa]
RLRPDPRSNRDRDSKLQMLNPQQESQPGKSVSFSSDKKYDITQVKAPPQLQKTMC